MLAVRWPEPFADADWGFEIKWDGVRVVMRFDGEAVGLHSRAGNDVTTKYPELGAFHAARPLILDGEVVAFDEAGRPSFERLQSRMNLAVGLASVPPPRLVPIVYVVFDVLYDGVPVLDLPWRRRRALLESMEMPAPFVRTDVVDRDPSALWELVKERGIEGIVAKRHDSQYRPGVRSPHWRKITAFRHARAVVGGYTPGEGGRVGTFGSLLLGLWTPDGLRWVGAVGSGFSDAELRAIRNALDRMRVVDSPFLPDAGLPQGAVWVVPQLVAMVQHKEWTAAGRLRGPSFEGFTDDDPATMRWETEGPEGPG